jgi:cytochrome c biogenesis protein CcdA
MNKRRECTIVKLGLILMMTSLILFSITLLYFYAISIAASRDFVDEVALFDPVFSEALVFAHGLIVVLVGLLIGLLRKQANLEEKRKNAIVIVKLGLVLMSISIIPLFYYYGIYLPSNERYVPYDQIDTLFIGTMNFVLGLVVVLIGLLSLLIGRLKKQESL